MADLLTVSTIVRFRGSKLNPEVNCRTGDPLLLRIEQNSYAADGESVTVQTVQSSHVLGRVRARDHLDETVVKWLLAHHVTHHKDINILSVRASALEDSSDDYRASIIHGTRMRVVVQLADIDSQHAVSAFLETHNFPITIG